MKIYVSHSKNFDYKKELYEPLKNSQIAEFIFPHESSKELFDSKNFFKNKECDLILAEVSYPATGQGVELGWANIYGIPIVCVYKTGSKFSNSLSVICEDFIEYTDINDLTNKLTIFLKQNYA